MSNFLHAVIFLTGLLLASPGCHETSDTFCPELPELRSGDLLFRRGRSAESHVVLATDRNSHFSHVGIICVEDQVPYVIHAVPGENKGGPDFIKKERLSGFLAPEKASAFSVYRSNFSENSNAYAARLADSYYKNRVLFDHKYDLNTDDKMYCTELILKVFQQAVGESFRLKPTRLPGLFGNIRLIMPGDIILNPHFQLIINQ
jgi:hypothetical protein